VLVAFIWGTNFVVVRVGLNHAEPLFLATMRFALSVVPAISFVRRPPVPLPLLAGAGLALGLQFAFLFPGMQAGVTPGLASLLVQMQVFFTILIAAMALKQPVRPIQVGALVTACCGLGLIALMGRSSATPLGIALVLAAAAAWAASNILAAKAGPVNMVAFVVWASPFAVVPLLIASFAIEGRTAFMASLTSMDPVVWGVSAWQAYANTIVGYGIWNALLSRYPASRVAPLAFMVPIFGMLASALVLHEGLEARKLAAISLVMAGLVMNHLADHRVAVSHRAE
jgi:O-acetylserine/cysteine efflux transporter